jgi:hypothetical protein
LEETGKKPTKVLTKRKRVVKLLVGDEDFSVEAPQDMDIQELYELFYSAMMYLEESMGEPPNDWLN